MPKYPAYFTLPILGSVSFLAIGIFGAMALRHPVVDGYLLPDARAALEWLAVQSFVDPVRIALVGISLGGWLALALASRTDSVCAVVSLSPLLAWEDAHEWGGIYLDDPETGEPVGQPGHDRHGKYARNHQARTPSDWGPLSAMVGCS